MLILESDTLRRAMGENTMASVETAPHDHQDPPHKDVNDDDAWSTKEQDTAWQSRVQSLSGEGVPPPDSAAEPISK